MSLNELCSGCNHPLSEHFRDVKGHAHCLHSVVSMVSTALMGSAHPSIIKCDCVEFLLPTRRARLVAKDKSRPCGCIGGQWCKECY